MAIKPNPHPLTFIFKEKHDGGSSDVVLAAVEGGGRGSPFLARQGSALDDTIFDFRNGDTINLAGIDANSVKAGHQQFKFIGDEDFHHRPAELHIVRKADYLIVEADRDGNGSADFQIEVHGPTKLAVDDFVI
jgi:hypothetical protein